MRSWKKILPLISTDSSNLFQQWCPFVANMVAVQPHAIAFSPDILSSLKSQECRGCPSCRANKVPRTRDFLTVSEAKRSVGISIEFLGWRRKRQRKMDRGGALVNGDQQPIRRMHPLTRPCLDGQKRREAADILPIDELAPQFEIGTHPCSQT